MSKSVNLILSNATLQQIFFLGTLKLDKQHLLFIQILSPAQVDDHMIDIHRSMKFHLKTRKNVFSSEVLLLVIHILGIFNFLMHS